RELPLTALLLELESRDATAHGTPLLDGRLERRADAPPERDEHPLRTARILPCRHRAPDAGGVIQRVVVARTLPAVERGPMILAAQHVSVEQPQAAFLARSDEEVLALVVEHHRRDVDVEVPLVEPVGIRRRVPVLQ